jgi:aminoglycoside phosphotransferase family enzyme/predicted kinase
MDLSRLIEAMSDPGAYPDAPGPVAVHQTHISVVFLAGRHAYKIKKPVDLGFLDFTTLEKRRHFCAEEVRLNRRLAPSVYQAVVPVTAAGPSVHLAGDGPVVEWAVQMTRLPAEATLERRLQRGEVAPERLEALARRLADFHASARSDAPVAEQGRFAVVAGNARENFAQARPLIGTTLSAAVFDRLQALTEAALAEHRPLIEARARRGVPRDTHGDLHLDHVYLFPEKPPPEDLVIVDCIEFNERFRFADPVADMAFLVMDLRFHGRRDLAMSFADAYFTAAGDGEGRALLPFYTAYRAAVRGKVEGFELGEREIPAAERDAARQRARAHWLLALGELEEPGKRPGLVLVGGLPGSGKSTLARGLAERAGFDVLRSDVIRKELAGHSPTEPATADVREGLYRPEWTERTYAECLARAERLLFEGRRALVDASFREGRQRRAFLEAAGRWGVPAVFLLCHAAPEVVRQRLAGRRGDASDADATVYTWAAERWEEPGEVTRPFVRRVATDGDGEQALGQAWAALREIRLVPDS